MIAGIYNLKFDEGADIDIQFIWKDDTATPINLIGYTARMKVKNTIDGDSVVDWGSYITLGGSDGTVNLNVPASATIDIGFLDGVYDIELVSNAGNVYKFLKGKVLITPEVTN